MRARTGVVAMALTLLSSCAPDRIDLGYRFEPSAPRVYEWRFDAVTNTDTPNEQSVRRSGLVVEITETVTRSKEPQRVRVRLDLVPKQASFDGRSAATPPRTSVVIELDTKGRPIEVADTGSGEGPDEMDTGPTAGVDRLIAAMRPTLPSKSVGIGDAWDAAMSLKADQTSALALKGRGRLERLTLEDGRKLAHVSIDRSGTASTQQVSGRAKILLSGRTRVRSQAAIDIDEGILVSDRSRSTSEFDMALEGGGRAGLLTISVTSTLELVT